MKTLLKLFSILLVLSFAACEQEMTPVNSSLPENLTILTAQDINELDLVSTQMVETDALGKTTGLPCPAPTWEDLADCFNGYGGNTPSSSCQAAYMAPVGFSTGIFAYQVPTTSLGTKRNYVRVIDILEAYILTCGGGQSPSYPDFQFSYDATYDLIIVEGLYHCCD